MRSAIKLFALIGMAGVVACLGLGCAAAEDVPQESVEHAILAMADGGEFAASDYVDASGYRLESCEVSDQKVTDGGRSAVAVHAVLANDSFSVQVDSSLDFSKEGSEWVLGGSNVLGTDVKATKGVDYLIGPADQKSLSGDSAGTGNKEPLSGYSGAESSFDEESQVCIVTLPTAQGGGNWFVHPASASTIKFVFDGKKWAKTTTDNAQDSTSDYLGQTFTDGACAVKLVGVTDATMQIEFTWSGEKHEQDPNSEGVYLPDTYSGLIGQDAIAIPFEASASYSGEYALGDSVAVNRYSQQSGAGFTLKREAGYEDSDTPPQLECWFTKDRSLCMSWGFQETAHQATFELA